MRAFKSVRKIENPFMIVRNYCLRILERKSLNYFIRIFNKGNKNSIGEIPIMKVKPIDEEEVDVDAIVERLTRGEN